MVIIPNQLAILLEPLKTQAMVMAERFLGRAMALVAEVAADTKAALEENTQEAEVAEVAEVDVAPRITGCSRCRTTALGWARAACSKA